MALFVFGYVLLIVLPAQSAIVYPNDDRQMQMEVEEVRSLLALKERMWKDPTATLSNWNPNQSHPCNWTGVSCTPGTYRVNRLSLPFRNLSGHLGAELGSLTHLQYLNISGNALMGGIPPELGRLKHLMVLDLSSNQLQTQIPVELGQCVALKVMNFAVNNLSGSIPPSLGNLTDLSSLNLSGGIPPQYWMSGNAQVVYLFRRNLTGEIPRELGKLKNLRKLDLSNNQLTGNIPAELRNLKRLHVLYLWGNNLTGEIPRELGKLENLHALYLSGNYLIGRIPKELCRLKVLKYLFLDNNMLCGEIPYEIKSLRNLSILSASSNSLTGNVPTSFGDLNSLEFLNLKQNYLNGTLPKRWRQRDNLRALLLQNNQLEGTLPMWIWRFTKLQTLDLSNNLFTGNISTEISQLQALQEASPVILNGSYDIFVQGDFSHIMKFYFKENEQGFSNPYYHERLLDLSGNHIGGRIPTQLGFLQGIRILNLSDNKLVGHIPQTLGNISNLESLDLSDNLLDGQIPEDLLNVESLATMNLSYNNLSGSIPTGRQFSTFKNSSYIGNINLCGFPLSKICEVPNQTTGIGNRMSSKKVFSEKTRLIVIIVPVVGILFLLSLMFYGMQFVLSLGMQFVVGPDMKMPRFWKDFKVDPTVLYNATDGYNDRNIIYRGATSTVYKGVLDDERLIAIKMFHTGEHNEEVELCFRTECKTRGQVRHRNLVNILGATSDFNSSTKMLVLQFMPNGSLDMHLHNSEICLLSWETRLKIAQGVAEALEYLHEQSGRGQIIHCDVKPSNILLDQDFEAHLNDFGISRVVDTGVLGSTLSSTFRGSIDYMAPEFGYSEEVSTKADVYSYGVVLLEMITRKTPSSMFVGQSSLVEWITNLFPDKAMTAIDEALKADATTAMYQQISSVIRLALYCTQPAPNDRPSMREVLRILGDLKGDRYQTFTNINRARVKRRMKLKRRVKLFRVKRRMKLSINLS